jgi:NAD-reducing hydrogenase small subunit
LLVSLGDCAVTSNIPGMRNPFGVQAVLRRAYLDTVTIAGPPPSAMTPLLLDRVRPVHEVVPVDIFLPGCPPSADLIFKTLDDLLAGRHPQGERHLRFGA